jgi:AraC-like DNA-binding protein
MPFAPKIRKDILKALEESILPTLQSQSVRSLLMEPPFDFSGIECRTLWKDPLPDNDKGPLQVIRQWPEHQLVASRGFNISFLYDGFMHKRVGVLESHAKAMREKGLTPPPGIQIVKLLAPIASTAASFTAREDGSICPEAADDQKRTISICFDGSQAYTFQSIRNSKMRVASHHLQLKDQTILHLGSAYLEELRINHNQQYAQTLLLGIMFRLRYLLLHTKPAIGNSCWIDPVTKLKNPLTDTQIKHQALCDEVIDYIQNNLTNPLTLKSIASHFALSESHLNEIFREVHDTTLMRYVTQLRINVVKEMLVFKRERVSDIAQLTGFASATSLSHIFRNQTGMSPREYRARCKKSP